MGVLHLLQQLRGVVESALPFLKISRGARHYLHIL